MSQVKSFEAHAEDDRVHCDAHEYEDNRHFREAWSWCVEEEGGDVNERQNGETEHNENEEDSTELLESAVAVFLKNANGQSHQESDHHENHVIPEKSRYPIHYHVDAADELQQFRFCYALLDVKDDEEWSHKSHCETDVEW